MVVSVNAAVEPCGLCWILQPAREEGIPVLAAPPVEAEGLFWKFHLLGGVLVTDVRSDWLGGYKEAGLWLQRRPPPSQAPPPPTMSRVL